MKIGPLMPRYFFDLADHQVISDTDGTELASDDEARGQAVAFAGAYLKDHPELAWDGRELRVHVFAEPRRPLFVVLVVGIDLARPEADKGVWSDASVFFRAAGAGDPKTSLLAISNQPRVGLRGAMAAPPAEGPSIAAYESRELASIQRHALALGRTRAVLTSKRRLHPHFHVTSGHKLPLNALHDLARGSPSPWRS